MQPPLLQYRAFGKTGFMTPAAGFGGYRIDYRIAEHYDALVYAIRKGITLIDTSANYTDGGSELLIGKALRTVQESDGIGRDQVFLVSKAGYIQGKNLEIANQREINGKPYPEVVKCSKDLWHCIHPEFLEDQLHLSLERLGTGYLDGYLLHNPEYFLQYTPGQPVTELHEEYYRRIRMAFTWMEEKVKEGKIRYYGISSNTFPETAAHPAFTSLERVIAAATAVTTDHHFAIVQFPMNLFEKGAQTVQNQAGCTKTLLEYAQELDLAVMINRPLNAITSGRLTRLADFPVQAKVTDADVTHALMELREYEERMISEVVEGLPAAASDKYALKQCLSIGEYLSENRDSLTEYSHFIDVKRNYFIPRAGYVVRFVSGFSEAAGQHQDLIEGYSRLVPAAFARIEDRIAATSNARNLDLHGKLNRYLPGEVHALPLSQKAILMTVSSPGVGVALVGIRRQRYVDDVLSIPFGTTVNSAGFWKEPIPGSV